MASKSQRKATRTHRRRAAARGFVRVEVQALKKDAGLIRALAETLRGGPEKAEALRSTLTKAVMNPEMTAFDIFGSELFAQLSVGALEGFGHVSPPVDSRLKCAMHPSGS